MDRLKRNVTVTMPETSERVRIRARTTRDNCAQLLGCEVGEVKTFISNPAAWEHMVGEDSGGQQIWVDGAKKKSDVDAGGRPSRRALQEVEDGLDLDDEDEEDGLAEVGGGDPYDKMTGPQLRKYAKENDIDLGGETHVDPMRAIIREYWAQAGGN